MNEQEITKLLEKYWFDRKDKDMKNIDILFDYIKRNPNITRKELKEVLTSRKVVIERYKQESGKPLMSLPTFNRHLKTLRSARKILFDNKTKTYRINPFYREQFQNAEDQLKFEFESQLRKVKNLEIASFLENELWERIHHNTILSIDCGEELRGKIHFSKEISYLLGRLEQSIMRECIIMNPELWYIMNKPEHFDIRVNFYTNLSQDPRIFELINSLREHYLEELKVIPFNTSSHFSRKIIFDYSGPKELKLKESKKDKLVFKLNKPKDQTNEQYLKGLYAKAHLEYDESKEILTKLQKEKENFEEYIQKVRANNIKSNYSYFRKLEEEIGKLYPKLYKRHREEINDLIKIIEKDQKEFDQAK